jgi:pimeloyl-ACP methyl ester carboxylesterase
MERLTLCGVDTHLVFHGTEHNRDTAVVFLHGWGSTGSAFGRLLSAAGEKYFTVAPDLPGFGGSEEPKTPWTVEEYADHTVELVKSLGIQRVIFVVHSFGGRIAITLGARKNLPFAIEKMIFFSAAGLKPKRGLGYYAKVYTYKLCKLLLTPFPRIKKRYQGSKGSADYKNASPMMKQILSKAVNTDLTPLLPAISAPTLLIWGEKDTATPLYMAKTMESKMQDAGLFVIQGAGHFAFAEQPAVAIAALKNFI